MGKRFQSTSRLLGSNFRNTWKINRPCDRALRGYYERPYSISKRNPSAFFISSLAGSGGQRLGAAWAHWGKESSLHWSLDVSFREGQGRVSVGHSPQDMATLRQIAHDLLKRETSLKVVIQGKRLLGGWRGDYLQEVLLS